MNLENVKCVGITMQVKCAGECVEVRKFDVSDCIEYNDYVTVVDLFEVVVVHSKSFIILDSCCEALGIVDFEARTIDTHLDVNPILKKRVEAVDFRENVIFVR